jgi:cytidylate kinase
MPVITISKEHGAGGREIARELARGLNYELADKAVIIKVAQQAKVGSERVEKFDQDEYSPLSKYLSNLFLANPSLYSVMGFEMPMAGPLPSGGDFFDAEQYLKFTQAVIENLYQKGDVVLVGRGSQYLLAGRPGCLHVRVAAPIEVRIKRVMERQEVGEKEARERIQKKDKARAAYVRDFYGQDWADSSHYHLIINTGLFSIEKAVGLIREAVKLV